MFAYILTLIMNRKIEFYKTENGRIPVKDFLDELSLNVVQKISWVLKLVSTDGLWECRIKFQGNIYRIICFFHFGNLIVLTNGFQKKTQKTPANEIELATKYKNDFLRRFADGTK